MTDLGIKALEYHQEGWSVIPVKPAGKTPLVKWEQFQKKRATAQQVKEWWEKWDNANIAIITGDSGQDGVISSVVLDVDFPAGEVTLKKEGLEPSDTLTALTGGGGSHYIYEHPGFPCKNSSSSIGNTKLPGVDIRGEGGYIVVEPSVHENGKKYKWLIEGALIKPAPEWMLKMLKTEPEPEPNGKVTEEDWKGKLTEGERNSGLTKMVGSLLSKMSVSDALPMIKAWNLEHCEPPLEDSEVEKIVDSIDKKEKKKRKKEEATIAQVRECSIGDLKNSERLRQLMNGDMLYLIEQRLWLRFNGKVWEKDLGEGSIYAYAKQVVRTIIDEAMESDRDKASKLFQEAKSLSGLAKQKNMIELTSKIRDLQVSVNELDSNPMLLSCENGTLDLRTGELREHRREDLITRICPTTYDRHADCPEWEKFVSLIMGGDRTTIAYLQRAMGYSLTGVADEKCFFVLYGHGDNGKTTFIENISYLMGDGLAVHTPVTSLVTKNPNQSEGVPNDIARMKGARMVFTSEIGQTHRLNEERIKAMTGGGGAITARFMRAEWFTFKPEFKIWMDTNYKPSISGTDPAMWNRVHLIPFEVCIPKVTEKVSRRDVDKMFEAERSGILNWALKGCNSWQETGLRPPEVVLEATEKYKEESDPLLSFFEECVDLKDGARVPKQTLYETYQDFCTNNNIKYPLGQKNFSQTLLQRGFKEGRETTPPKHRYFEGLELKPFAGGKVTYNNETDDEDRDLPF